MSLALAGPRSVLADRVIPRTLVTDALLVVGGAVLTAGLAQVVVPMWPVPITGQTLAVLLVGASLGAARGASSLALYLVMGLVGLPVFSDASAGVGVVLGATGGYLIGFIPAAAFVGWLAQRDWDRKVLQAFVAFLGGSVIVFSIGMLGLALALGSTLGETLQWGLLPFLPGELIKAAIAASLLPAAWWGLDRISARRRTDATR